MSRKRVTITIKQDILSQVDRLVDGVTIRSRSQAMEFLLNRLLAEHSIKSALVLCGGRKSTVLLGKRPRFLAELGGKSVIERVLNSINEFKVNKFFVYTESLGEQIVEDLSRKSLPYHVEFVSEKNASGTIEPLLLARKKFSETFLVAYGDTLTSINLSDMLAFHKQNNSIATIALTTVSNPRKYGVVELQGNKIASFMEKPRKNIDSFMISAGYFIFEPEIFRHIGRGMKNIESDLFPKLAEKGLLYGYTYQGKYLNIHSQHDLERAKILV